MKTIDADRHVIEPADLWERELPAVLRQRGFAVRWNADSRQEEVHVDGRLVFLASDAKWITGAVLRVDGGIVIQ